VLVVACKAPENTFGGDDDDDFVPPTDGVQVPEPEPEPVDSAPPPVVEETEFSGEYRGTVGANVTYQENIGAQTIVYQCVGPFDVTIGATLVSASGPCVTDYAEVLQIELSGEVTTPPFISGSIHLSHPTFQFDDVWQGEFTVDEFQVKRLEGQSDELINGPPEINSYVNFTVKH
jgi:hypothetical protein